MGPRTLSSLIFTTNNKRRSRDFLGCGLAESCEEGARRATRTLARKAVPGGMTAIQARIRRFNLTVLIDLFNADGKLAGTDTKSGKWSKAVTADAGVPPWSSNCRTNLIKRPAPQFQWAERVRTCANRKIWSDLLSCRQIWLGPANSWLLPCPHGRGGFEHCERNLD